MMTVQKEPATDLCTEPFVAYVACVSASYRGNREWTSTDRELLHYKL